MPRPAGDTGAWLDSWAATVFRRRWLILGIWAVLLVGGLIASADLETRLHGSVGTVAGGGAERVETVLTRDFDTPYAQFLVITNPQGATPALLATLQRFPMVAASRSLPATPATSPSSVIVGLKTRTMAETEAQVPALRQYLKNHGFLQALVTGIAPMSLDVVRYASRESARAERTVLPLTLIALVLAFGALGAALLPLLTGLGAVVVTMGCLALIARFMPLSVYASNIATMLGLGLGIDYALFLVSRWRDERRQGATDQAALHAAIRHGTPAILASSATVLLGLIALAVVPSEETRGLGIGGLVVVLFSGLAAVTLLPALAATFGHWAEYPRWLSNWRFSGASRWVGITRWVLRRPILASVAAFALLAV
ncbi:MAG: MMPL family transporter, partial [Candidatus Sericytochromatia bacterium]|nr:MMPL family transporter [Candidatus Sericytochromatia bacterium]